MPNTTNYILAFVPIFIYYFPNSLFELFFNRQILQLYDEFFEKKDDGNISPDAFNEVQRLKNKILNLISYLSFVSLYFGTIITLLLNQNFRNIAFQSSIYIFSFIVYILIGGVINIKIISMDLNKNKIEDYIIGLIVLASATSILFLT